MQIAFEKKPTRSSSARHAPMESLRLSFSALFIGVLFIANGCVTPRISELSPAEKLNQDDAVGLVLAQKFESEVEERDDPTLCKYLEELASALVRTSSSLSKNPVRVRIIKDPEKRARNYAFPGNRIYLSRSMLRSIRFENELAAAIALELAHVEKRDLIARYEKVAPASVLLGEGGLLDFPPELQRKALEPAMQMMYQAGFDPRGMAHFLGRYQEDSEQSPYDSTWIKEMVESSWRIIALHAPLRNPIIRSDRFLAIYQRMQNL